jgi:hypothetical protein
MKPQGAFTPATDTASVLMQVQATKVNTYHIQEATEKLMNVITSFKNKAPWKIPVLKKVAISYLKYTVKNLYSKTCLKWNAIVLVFFFPPFSQVSVLQRVVLIKQSTKNMIA